MPMGCNEREKLIISSPWKCTLLAMHMNSQWVTLHESYGKYMVSKSFTKEQLLNRVHKFLFLGSVSSAYEGGMASERWERLRQARHGLSKPQGRRQLRLLLGEGYLEHYSIRLQRIERNALARKAVVFVAISYFEYIFIIIY